MRAVVVLLAVSACLATAGGQSLATFDGVTFADTGRGKIYFPVREAASHLDWKLTGPLDALKLNSVAIPKSRMRPLPNGTKLVDVAWLQHAGAIVNHGDGKVTVKSKKKPGKAFYVRAGQKRVFINKKEQSLVAFQGRRSVLRTQVSTGKRGKETPLGLFRAKGKEKMHKSRLYNNVPMPWSIHIVGNVFVHGFKSTPANASAGCIRVPLTGSNPARWLYYWTETGTPITVSGKWPAGAKAAKKG